MSDITVGFGADTSDFEKGKQKVIGGFKEVGDAAKKTQPALDKIGAGKATKGLGGLADTTRQARFAMTNLNRVVSDAPFGFIAIQNNIDQAAFSLLNLIRTTGGAKAAMKALAASFTGFGGIVTIITLASALYLAFGDTIKEAFSKGSKAAAEYKEALNEAIESSIKLKDSGIKDVSFTKDGAIDAYNQKQQDISDLETEIKNATEGKIVAFGQSATLTSKLTGLDKVAIDQKRTLIGVLKKESAELEKKIAAYDAEFMARTRAASDGATSDEDTGKVPSRPRIEATNYISDENNAADERAEEAEAAIERTIALLIKQYEAEQKLRGEMQRRTLVAIENASIEAEAAEAAVRAREAEANLQATVIEYINEETEAAEKRREAQEKAQASLDAAVTTVDIFSSDAIEALADIAVGLEKIEDIGRIVGNVIKNLARDLIIAAAKAALLKVLFPGSAGAAGGFKGLFKGFLGLTGISAEAPSLAAPRVTDTLSFGTSGLGSAASTIQLQATSIGINGDQLKILVEQADRRSIRQRGY